MCRLPALNKAPIEPTQDTGRLARAGWEVEVQLADLIPVHIPCVSYVILNRPCGLEQACRPPR